jgi:lysophospholipase L1-like esterase
MIGVGVGISAVATRKGGAARPDTSTVLDFGEGRWWSNGVKYTDETSFLAAVGAVKSGSAYTFGPTLPAGAPEMLTNSDFSGGTTGWTASVQSGGAASLSASAGELTLTAAASVSASVLQSVATELGVAYLLAMKGKRGTVTTAGIGGIAIGLSTIAGITKQAATTAYLEDTRYVPSLSSVSMSFGGRMFGTTDTGTAIYDYISAKKVLPFLGYKAGGFAVRIKAKTPASAPGAATVIYKADSNYVSGASETDQTAANNVLLTYDASKNVTLSMSFAGNPVASLVLGSVDVNTEFEAVINIMVNRVAGCIVGKPFPGFVTSTNNGIAGVAAVRVGRSRAGEQFTGEVKRVRQWDAPFSDAVLYSQMLTDAAFVAWGDSLTYGTGATSTATSYPAVLSGLFSPARAVIAKGIGGQTSTQIAARMGAQPIAVTVTGNQIPASGGVAITARSINPLVNSGAYSGTMVGTLAGVYGTMSTDASGNWTFTRATAGSVTACPAGTVFVPELPSGLRARKSLLWLGRNGADAGGYDVVTDIAAAVASLGHDRYLIGSILTASGDSAGVVSTITGRNATLASTYGPRYVDILGALQAANDGSANDLSDVAAGWTPRSLRAPADPVHLNDAGYAIAAPRWKAAADAFGW